MSVSSVDAVPRMSPNNGLDQNGSSLDFGCNGETTACDELAKKRKIQVEFFPPDENCFLESDNERQKDFTTNKNPSCSAAESTTELANALLSLGGKQMHNEKEPILQMKDAFQNYGHLPYPSELHAPPQWMTSSTALIGYPFTYGLNHVPPCSCNSRHFPNQSWNHPLLMKTQDVPPINHAQATKAKQGLCFPPQLQHPFVLASNAFPTNFPNCPPFPVGSKLSEVMLQQQQLSSMKIGSAQKMFAQNTLKMMQELPAKIQSMPQDIPTPSSVAVVAPMILEFNQNNHVQGVPLICNVNQWLNMSSGEFATNKHEGNVMNSSQNPQTLSDVLSSGNQRDQGQPVLPLQSSSSLHRDPITQLGEAANLILQSTDYAAGGGPNVFDGDSSCKASKSEANSFQPITEFSSRPTQAKIKKASQNSSSKSIKNRTCPYCQRVFARPFTLKSHIRRHTKEKPFTCLICQRSFSQSATLENHKLTHTGAKPHQCGICLKRFAHQTSLKTHLRIHSGEQPYQCDYCHRRFSDGSTLQKHKRTHNGERPFHCLFCDKSFSQSGNMRRHMATTHKAALLAKQGIADSLKS